MVALAKIARRGLSFVGVALALTACAPKVATGINDPNEDANRRTFEANLALDQRVFSNSGNGSGVPPVLSAGIVNFAENYNLPRSIVNSVLQGRLDRVVQNTARFAINTTVGIGGLFDPASVVNIPAAKTDFGETLYVWGVGEGKYTVLPVIGPSTQRHTAGRIVDLATNPLFWILPVPENLIIGPTATVLASAAGRSANAELVEDLVYGSADPYGQVRLFYLENRRFQLGQSTRGGAGTGGADDYVDPYAQGDFIDPYADLADPAPAADFVDPYAAADFIDPYEDPYAQ